MQSSAKLSRVISGIPYRKNTAPEKVIRYMSCARPAASVAMVICAHSPRLSGGSHWDLSETEDSAMESQLTAAPKTSIIT